MLTTTGGSGEGRAEVTPDVDVLIVGAGLSGIGMACHLTRELPGRTYEILETLERLCEPIPERDRVAFGIAWRPSFREALDLFDMLTEASGSGDEVVEDWRDVAEDAGPPPAHLRRKRPTGRGRRRGGRGRRNR